MFEKSSQRGMAGYAERNEIALRVITPVVISMVNVQGDIVAFTSSTCESVSSQDVLADRFPAFEPRRVLGCSSFLSFFVSAVDDSPQPEVVTAQVFSTGYQRSRAFGTARTAFHILFRGTKRLYTVASVCTAALALGVRLIFESVAALASTLRKHDSFTDSVVMEAQLVRRCFYFLETIIRLKNQLPISSWSFSHAAPPTNCGISSSIARKREYVNAAT